MGGFQRYAVYYAPRPGGALGRFGAAWLGWDAETGREAAGPEPDGLPRPRAELTAAPRRYGFHGTLKAPFRLADGATAAALERAVAELAAAHAAFAFAIELRALGAFLALVPAAEVAALGRIAADCVRALDGFRAAATPSEIARRDPARLGAREAAHLAAWGYPYVFEAFRFHLTLTGPLPEGDQAVTRRVLEGPLAPILAVPLAFEDLCLFGEDAAGRFHMISRHPLAGAARP